MNVPIIASEGSGACPHCGKMIEACPPPCSMLECNMSHHFVTDCNSAFGKASREKAKTRRKKRREQDAKDRRDNWQKVTVYLPKTAVKILKEATKRGYRGSMQDTIKESVDEGIARLKAEIESRIKNNQP